eukprot:symbB.v1.2.020493.t1/scaffold1730.1/size104407/6
MEILQQPSLNGRLALPSLSPLYLSRCMERILHKVAVSGTLHASDGGPALVQYSGHIKGLFAKDADLEIELQSKMERITECGEEVAENVLRIVAHWNLENDQIVAWKEDTGIGINDWVGHLDVLGCQLSLRNQLGSEIVLKFLAPYQKPPTLMSWLEKCFTDPRCDVFRSLELGLCCGPLFMAFHA